MESWVGPGDEATQDVRRNDCFLSLCAAVWFVLLCSCSTYISWIMSRLLARPLADGFAHLYVHSMIAADAELASHFG